MLFLEIEGFSMYLLVTPEVCGIALLGILTEYFVISPQVMAHSTPQGILDDVAMVS